jgi:uroporphyrinogen-III synthase
MATGASTKTIESYKQIKSILISQPKPERSPYFDIEKKWGIKIDWRPFIHVEAVPEKEFRKNRLRPDDYTVIIFTSKNSIEHFFRMCEEMRVKLSQQTKYFCLTEAIANYLQKFIVYRKRKVFVGVRKIEDLETAFNKHKEKEKFLLPCSNLGAKDIVKYLDDNEIEYKEAMMYRTVSSDLSDLKDITYDCLVFFSPLGIQSLYDNFPNFKQNNTRLAVYGNLTSQAVEERGLTVNIMAPAPEVPSLSMALTNYLNKSNK